MIVRKHRATCEVADIIHGNINSDELFMHLLTNSESFREQMTIEIREEYERQQREMLLMEQEQAYQESLLADRAKEEAKQQKEKMIASERRRQESERAETEARKEAIRKDVWTIFLFEDFFLLKTKIILGWKLAASGAKRWLPRCNENPIPKAHRRIHGAKIYCRY